jgi:hypothetical protein
LGVLEVFEGMGGDGFELFLFLFLFQRGSLDLESAYEMLEILGQDYFSLELFLITMEPLIINGTAQVFVRCLLVQGPLLVVFCVYIFFQRLFILF